MPGGSASWPPARRPDTVVVRAEAERIRRGGRRGGDRGCGGWRDVGSGGRLGCGPATNPGTAVAVGPDQGFATSTAWSPASVAVPIGSLLSALTGLFFF
jgi:hypothetical protein